MGWRRKGKVTSVTDQPSAEVPLTEDKLPIPKKAPDTGPKRITLPDGTVREYLDTGTVRTTYRDGTVEEDDPLMGRSVILPGRPNRRGLDIRPGAEGWERQRGFDRPFRGY